MKKVTIDGDSFRLSEGPIYMPFSLDEARSLQASLNSFLATHDGHKPPPITGYRTLPQSTVDLMNQIKALGNDHIDPLVKRVRDNEAGENKAFGSPDAEPHRWIAIANTHFQQGLMALLRAVAKPGGY